MRGVRDDGFAGNVVGQDLAIRIQDGAAFRIDGLFVNVLLRGEPGVLVMLDHLQVNEPKRRRG